MGGALSADEVEEEDCAHDLHVLGSNATDTEKRINLLFTWTCGSNQRTHFAIVENQSIVVMPKLFALEARGQWVRQDHVTPSELGIKKMALYTEEEDEDDGTHQTLSYDARYSWAALLREHRQWILERFHHHQSEEDMTLAHVEDGEQNTYALCIGNENEFQLCPTVVIQGPEKHHRRREWSEAPRQPTLCCGTMAIVQAKSLRVNDMCGSITSEAYTEYLEERRAVLERGSIREYREFILALAKRSKYLFNYELHVAPIEEYHEEEDEDEEAVQQSE